MTRVIGPIRVALALSVLALLVPTARAGDDVVVRTSFPTPIAAYGGWLAWSDRDASTGAFRLVLRSPTSNGAARRPAIAPRSVPFDVDLGPGVGGGVVAAYSRCKTEPAQQGGYPTPMAYHSGRGCVPYVLNVAGGAERRVTRVAAPDASEVWPSPWRGSLAFERTYDRKRSVPYLYVGRYDRPARSVRVPGGPQGRQARASSSANGLDLYGRRLAFAWTFPASGEGPDTQIRLDTLGGGAERVAAQGGGGITQVELGWPAFDGGWLSWSRECYGDPEGCPRRYGLERRRIAGGAVEHATGPKVVISHDVDGPATYVLVPVEPCSTVIRVQCDELRRLTPKYG